MFRVNSTWPGFHYDILNFKSVLQKNDFPLKLIDKSISNCLCNNVFKQKENEQMPLLESTKKRFYKLPYIGNFSIQTKKKLNNIVLKFTSLRKYTRLRRNFLYSFHSFLYNYGSNLISFPEVFINNRTFNNY